jgi:hypothetical protein
MSEKDGIVFYSAESDAERLPQMPETPMIV